LEVAARLTIVKQSAAEWIPGVDQMDLLIDLPGLVNIQFANWKMAIEIVDFLNKNGKGEVF
jgi:hypothetical protein